MRERDSSSSSRYGAISSSPYATELSPSKLIPRSQEMAPLPSIYSWPNTKADSIDQKSEDDRDFRFCRKTNRSSWEKPIQLRYDAELLTFKNRINSGGLTNPSLATTNKLANQRIFGFNKEKVDQESENVATPEKKQSFNAYKTQRAKEEEHRFRAKKTKENLENLLQTSTKMISTNRYRKAEQMFEGEEIWNTVPFRDRKDLYEDIFFSAKKDKEEAKSLRKLNMKALSDILDSMTNVTYRTTWQEAQQLLLDNTVFAEDTELLNMDKEDALIVYEKRVRQLEQDEEEEKERERRRIKRQHRKNRDSFIAFLDELNDQKKLTSMSLWMEVYPIISADSRFSSLLGQSDRSFSNQGSTLLNLFKFYKEDLKAQFQDEMNIITLILKEKDFQVEEKTTFEEFATVVSDDKRSATLDAANVKLSYNTLLKKAEATVQEHMKEEARKIRRLERAFRGMLKNASPPVTASAKWEEIRHQLETESAFTAITLESERVRLFEEYQQKLRNSQSNVVDDRQSRFRSSSGSREGKAKECRKWMDNHSRETTAESVHFNWQKRVVFVCILSTCSLILLWMYCEKEWLRYRCSDLTQHSYGRIDSTDGRSSIINDFGGEFKSNVTNINVNNVIGGE